MVDIEAEQEGWLQKQEQLHGPWFFAAGLAGNIFPARRRAACSLVGKSG